MSRPRSVAFVAVNPIGPIATEGALDTRRFPDDNFIPSNGRTVVDIPSDDPQPRTETVIRLRRWFLAGHRHRETINRFSTVAACWQEERDFADIGSCDARDYRRNVSVSFWAESTLFYNLTLNLPDVSKSPVADFLFFQLSEL